MSCSWSPSGARGSGAGLRKRPSPDVSVCMNRRFFYGASTFLLTAVLATTIVRCELPATAFTSFSYRPHERPRVFVSHHPLRAVPGQTLTIRLTPDLRAEDGEVQQAR